MATEKQPRGPIGQAPATGYCRRHLHFSGDESRQLRQEEEEDEDAAEDGNCGVGGQKRGRNKVTTNIFETGFFFLFLFFFKHDSEITSLKERRGAK